MNITCRLSHEHCTTNVSEVLNLAFNNYVPANLLIISIIRHPVEV